MGSPSLALVVASIAVVALLADPAHGAGCNVKPSAKFKANQTIVYPDSYFWQVSPCKADDKICPGQKLYINQWNSAGSCDKNQLQCTEAPKVTKTSTGYTLNYYCGTTLNGEKDAVVQVTCGKGPLTLTAAGVPITQVTGNPVKYTYTFVMTGECSSDFDYGWIFVIIVLVGFVLYLLGGFVFNFFVRKLRGLEAIPNIGFWKDLPGLIKDGFMFAFCRRRSGFKTVA